MIFTRDFVTCENHWQIASVVTQKLLFTVTHASSFISSTNHKTVSTVSVAIIPFIVVHLWDSPTAVIVANERTKWAMFDIKPQIFSDKRFILKSFRWNIIWIRNDHNIYVSTYRLFIKQATDWIDEMQRHDFHVTPRYLNRIKIISVSVVSIKWRFNCKLNNTKRRV